MHRQLGEIEYAKTFFSKINRPFKKEFENKRLPTLNIRAKISVQTKVPNRYC